MSTLSRSAKEFFTEMEAAAAIGISVARLHQLLDENIFNDGHTRPHSLEFTSSDLLLLSYWNTTRKSPAHEVILMPPRK